MGLSNKVALVTGGNSGIGLAIAQRLAAQEADLAINGIVPLSEAKNFLSTVSPWVITTEALAPYRTAAMARAAGDPRPLPYLLDPQDQASGGLRIELEVFITTRRMRDAALEAHRISHGDSTHLWWTPAQMVAHHTVGGCDLQAGDLIGTGTISSADRAGSGCLLELTQGGRYPIELPNGERRTFLEDGDEIVLRGQCRREGFATIGFGECRGRVQG